MRRVSGHSSISTDFLIIDIHISVVFERHCAFAPSACSYHSEQSGFVRHVL